MDRSDRPISDTDSDSLTPLSADDIRLIDQICDRFEESSHQDALSQIDQLIGDSPSSVRSRLLEELLVIAIGNSQEPLSIEECKNRYPAYRLEIETAFAHEVTTDEEQALSNSVNESPELPERIGDYEIIAEIARGGMGIVYQARQSKLNRIVALKCILSGTLASSEEVQRFLTEAEAAAKLQHPHIVSVFDIGEDHGRPFFSMEFIKGSNLAEQIKNESNSVRWSCEMIRKTADAIDHAHQKGIIHRDLKPSNILINSEGEPKVTDFGLAKLADNNDSKTRTGDLLGTASYMAPEQALGQVSAISPATDIYGLGAIFYELLTGRPPFRGETSWQTMRQLMESDPVSISVLQPATPFDVQTIVSKCLRKDPRHRYQTAKQLSDDIQRFLDGKPILARPVSRMEKTVKWMGRNRSMVITITISAMLLVAAVIVGFWKVMEERDRFRVQRDQAQSNLYDALVGDTKAQLAGREDDYWFQAKENLNELAALEVPQKDKNDLRNLAIRWMGNPYPCLTQKPVCSHGSPVSDASFDKSGNLLVSCARNGEVRVSDLRSGNILFEKRYESSVFQAKIHHSGNWILVATDDNRLWIETIEQTQPNDQHHGLKRTFPPTEIRLADFNVSQLRFTPDGQQTLMGCSDGWLRIVENKNLPDSGKFVRLPGELGPVTDIEFSKNQELVAAVGKKKRLAIWEIKTRKQIQLDELERTPTCIAFIREDKEYGWSDTERFSLFFGSVGSEDKPKSGAMRNLHSQSISHLTEWNQRDLVTASSDGTISLHDGTQRTTVIQAKQKKGPVLAFDLHKKSRTIAAGYQNGNVVLWTINLSPFYYKFSSFYWTFFQEPYFRSIDAQFVTTLDLNQSPPIEVGGVLEGDVSDVASWETAPFPQRRWVARAKHDGFVEFVDENLTLQFHVDLCPETKGDKRDVVWCLDIHPDENLVLAGSGNNEQGFVNLIDVSSKQLVARESVNSKLVTSVKFQPDGQHLFSCSTDGSVDVWKLDKSSIIHVHRLARFETNPALSLAVSRRGDRLAVATFQDQVHIWDIAQILARDHHPSNATAVKPIHVIERDHGNAVRFVDFVKDDRFVVTGSENGAVNFYSSATMQLEFRMKTGEGQVRNVRFSNDGKWLAINSYVKPTYIWNFSAVQQQLEKWNLGW